MPNKAQLMVVELIESGKLGRMSELPSEARLDDLREVDPGDAPVIGEGRTSVVYDLGEKVLKLFRPQVPQLLVCQEFFFTCAAHDDGLPVPRAYEIVHHGCDLGILMEKVGGTTLDALMAEHPDQNGELLAAFTEAVRDFRRTRLADDRLPDIKQLCIALCDGLDPEFFSAEEAAALRAAFEAIPDAATFVQGDCQPGNAILSADGKVTFIDLMLCGRGHFVFDLMSMYSHCVFLPSQAAAGELGDGLLGTRLGAEEGEALFDAFLAELCPGMEADEIAETKAQVRGLHAARMCASTALLPGIYSEAALEEAKHRALDFSRRFCSGDEVEPYLL